jgi:hypothetical protein
MLLLAGCLGAGCGDAPPAYDTHPVVAATVAHFAPPVQLGAGIERMSVYFRNRRWIDHLGAVTRSNSPVFAQVRFFPDADVRAGGDIDWRAPLRAIELVSVDPMQRERTMSYVEVAMGAKPREGCLAPRADSLPMRTVHYWVAAGDSGGIGVVTDWSSQSPGLIDARLWSLWAWSGPSVGNLAFLDKFHDAPCVATTPARDVSDDPDVRALAALDRAVRDSLKAARQPALPGAR